MNTQNEEIQIVIFELNKEEFGIDINRIKEIIRVTNIINVPAAPDFVMGITNLRGSILPVINTRLKLSLENKEVNATSRMLVIEKEEKIFGFVVDKVNEVIRINSSLIEVTPQIVSSIDKEYTEGVLKLKDGKRLVLLLDVDKVLKDTSQKTENNSPLKKAVSQEEIKESKRIEEEQLVTFNIGKEEYGFEIEKVREILRVREITPVPNAPYYVKGMETIRGQLLPIIDLRKIFKEATLQEEKVAAIVIWEKEVEKEKEKFEKGIETKTEYPINNEAFIYWIEKYDTSNEEILNILAKMKKHYKLASKIAIEISKLNKEGKTAESEKKIIEELKPAFDNIKTFFEELKVFDFEKEQRILVISINGVFVGITVDNVNEVRIVQKNLIEKIPEIISSDNKELKNAIKVDDGKRLIVILDETKLISEAESKNLLKMNDTISGKREEKQDLEEEQYVVFTVSNEEYGINITNVKEINRISEITKMPRSPEHIEGMTNLRGEIIPLISLRQKFGIEKVIYDNTTRTVIVEFSGKKIGLIVDRVKQILKINKTNLELTPQIMSGKKEKDFITGIAKLNDGKRIVMLLDTNKMLKEDKEVLMQKDKKSKLVVGE